MSNQRTAGTTFDLVQDYSGSNAIFEANTPDLPDNPISVEEFYENTSGGQALSTDPYFVPGGPYIMHPITPKNEEPDIISQLGVSGNSYKTNQLNSQSSVSPLFKWMDPEVLEELQQQKDAAIRDEFAKDNIIVFGVDEMQQSDKLNPAKLCAQCNNYTEKLNTENSSLDALYTTFYNAGEVNLKGKTAGAFLDQCDNYCTIIECLQIANCCDIEDNSKLYNKLGNEYLDGEVIIPGRIEAINNWEQSIDNRNYCNGRADSCDDDDERAGWRSQAGYWQGMADSYYAEWERLTQLKEEFEDVNSFSKGLYKGNAPQLRSCAYQGMQLVGYAFEAGEYTMQSNVDEWKKSALQLKNTGLAEIAEKWKTDDGAWDMEALEAEISIEDPSVISKVEYLALGNAFESMDIEDKEKFVSLAFCVIDEEYQSATDTKLNISPVFQEMTEVYSENLNLHVDAMGKLPEEDQNKIFTYNLMYTYSYLQPFYIIDVMDMKGGEEGIDIRAKVDITQDGNNYKVKLYRDDIKFECPEFTLYGYTPILESPIDKEMELYAQKQRKDVWGDVIDSGKSVAVNVVIGKTAKYVEGKVLDSVPIIGTLYSVYKDYDSIRGAYDEASANNEAWTNIMAMDDMKDAAITYSMGGSVVATDGVVCVTSYTYSSGGINDAIESYNENHVDINYDAEELLHRIMVDPSYADQVRDSESDLYIALRGADDDKTGEQVHFDN